MVKNAYAVLLLLLLVLVPVSPVSALENGQEPAIGEIVGSFKTSTAKMVTYDEDDEWYEAKTIPVYAVDYDLCICVEDLQYYGYEMVWDQESRTTRLNISERKNWTGTTKYVKNKGNIFYSDVRVFVDGIEIKGYNIGGYTLVKIADINAIGNIYFGRRYGEQEKFDIKGKILLPSGDVAPRGGLNGKLIQYTYGYKGSPEKVTEQSFYIPENKNSCAYTATLTTEEFLGYELDDGYGYYNGSLFDEDGKPLEEYRIYTSPLNDYRVDYQDFAVNIFKTAQLQGTLTINGQIPAYPHENRSVFVLAEDVSGRGEILQTITVPCEQKEIPYSLPVIAGREYYLRCYATIYYYLPSRYELWAGPAPDLLFSGYYTAQGLLAEKDKADIIPVGEQGRTGLNIGIGLPEPISTGVVCKNDLKTYLKGDEILSLTVNGEPLVFLESFKGQGYDIEYRENKTYLKESLQSERINPEGAFDWLRLDELSAGSPTGYYLACNPDALYLGEKRIDSYRLYGRVVVFVKDLQESGLFKVTNDAENKTVNIDTSSTGAGTGKVSKI